MRISCLLAAVFGVLLANLAIASNFDALSDFSSSNPSGAWTYGYGATGTSFTPMSTYSSVCNATPGLACWQTSGLDLPVVAQNQTASVLNFLTVTAPTNALLLHPGPFTDAIVNWTAPSAGTYNIAGFFELLDISPTGIIGYVYDGSSQLLAKTLTGPPASQITQTPGGRDSFSFTETLAAGATISFGVNNDGNYLNDSTGFDATVRSSPAPTPEPSAFLLLLAGLLALPIYRRCCTSAPTSHPLSDKTPAHPSF